MKGKMLKSIITGTLCAAMVCSGSSAYAISVPAVTDIVSAKTEGDTVVYFSDFEDGDASAFTARNSGDTTVCSVTEENAVSGSKSLCASGRTKSWNGPSFRLDEKCEPGTAYLISAKVMGQYYTSVTMSLQYTDANGTEHYETLANLNGNGWQEVNNIKVSFTSDQTNVCVYFEGGTDNIYIDDFSVVAPEVKHPQSDIVSLKDAYKDYFKIGTAVTAKELAPVSTQELILKHFNSITAGNELKPDALLRQAESQEKGDNVNPQIDLSSARSILDFARDNNIPVRGHVLVWHSQTPDWFFKEGFKDDGDWVSKEIMLQRMENYIKNVFEAVKTEYPDVDFYAWDVVNECWLDDGNPRKPGEQGQNGSNNSAWVQIFGDNSFIPYAFKYAKQYAPEGTKLYYNDFNEYMPQKTDAIIKMVEEINADGHYIDGIGLQSHLDVSFPSVNVYKKALDKFCATGLDVQVTELDVTTSDTSEEGFKKQAQYYSDIMDTIVADKDSISAVVFWGTTDDQSWRASRYPLLFNEDYTAKEAFYSIVDGLEVPVEETTTTTTQETTTTTQATTVTTAEETTTEKVTSTSDQTETTVTSDIVYGDANGDGKVTLADCVAILQFIANSEKYPLTDLQKLSADVDGTEGITGSDALAIQNYDSKKITELPVKS